MNLRKFILKLLGRAKPRQVEIPQRYVCNLSPSKTDDRDNLYAVKVTEDIPLPPYSNFSAYCPPVKQQGSIGSCGSHAWASAIETAMNVRDKNPTNQDYIPLSERFHYYVVRQPEYGCTFPKDSGQYLRDGAKVCNQVGIAPEKLCPYIVSKFNEEPSFWAYGFAKFGMISSYNRCWNRHSIQHSLALQNPVVFGVRLYESFYQTGYDGKMPTKSGSLLGGHAMLAVGYDDGFLNLDGTKGAILVLNSWGNDFGWRGYVWIPYGYFDSSDFIEAWSFTVK